ncbi:polysaccharide pyruvyl transferase family protein [Pontibacter beigongshangensis]|uniref:polysaccharide pyruvyl transferase family protein n=1 Tax=Pontibacter beigongshangensis TaxID=2574733 RepID=UPI00164F6D25|nr:polysaccharide pyruvyl transferase family protein [Pontibacter beigongshangensis]
MAISEKIFNKLRFTKPATPVITEQLNYNHIDLYYWKPLTGELNFGDHLSKVVVSKVLADRNHLLEEETKTRRTLLAIGSVLHFASDTDVIWGTGVNGKVAVNEHTFSTLDVRAVRGPLTREFLQERAIAVPEVYGDPALLLPHIFPGRFSRDPQKKYVVVPNLHDLVIAEALKTENIVSPVWGWNRCVEEILKAEFVIASSLHGLIIAEAYGIPACYIRFSETENLFKYNDYLLGTGRGEIQFATTVAEALEMGGMAPPVFDAQKLLNAFPIDLWDE